MRTLMLLTMGTLVAWGQDAKKWAEQLQSDDEEKREEAAKKLKSMGEKAFEALVAAASGSNEQAATRARQLIVQIDDVSCDTYGDKARLFYDKDQTQRWNTPMATRDWRAVKYLPGYRAVAFYLVNHPIPTLVKNTSIALVSRQDKKVMDLPEKTRVATLSKYLRAVKTPEEAVELAIVLTMLLPASNDSCGLRVREETFKAEKTSSGFVVKGQEQWGGDVEVKFDGSGKLAAFKSSCKAKSE